MLRKTPASSGTSGMADDGELTIRGTFKSQDGAPLVGAVVHELYLGDPPTNCGTAFDLERAPAHTDTSGAFHIHLSALDEYLRGERRGAWRRGCFLILAAADARTLGYAIASGEELATSPVDLNAVPFSEMHGRISDEDGAGIRDARIEVERYLLFVGRGPHPSAPVNFWLSRSAAEGRWGDRVLDLTTRTDGNGSF